MSLRRISLRTAAVSTAALALAIAAPLAASAHVSATPSSSAAGSYSVITFANGHGCNGSPTTKLTVNLPSNITSVTPTVSPNWTIEKVMTGDAVTQVVYTAVKPLPDGYRDTVSLQVKLPADAAGQTLSFPVLQTCAVGETNWSEPLKADGTEPEHPAPTVAVTAATAADAHAHDSATSTADTNADIPARVMAVGGLIIGVVGIVIAVVTRRNSKKD
jgi:uncharacterized protein YcnI